MHLLNKLSFMCLFFDLQIYHSPHLTHSISRLTLLMSRGGRSLLSDRLFLTTQHQWVCPISKTRGRTMSIQKKTGHWNALSSLLFCCDSLRASYNTDFSFLQPSAFVLVCITVCVRVLWTAPSLSYHPHQLLMSCSSPKSSWPSSNKPISCNQELSHPFSYIHFDIYTQNPRHTHAQQCQLFMQVFFSPLWTLRRRRFVPKCSVAGPGPCHILGCPPKPIYIRFY